MSDSSDDRAVDHAATDAEAERTAEAEATGDAESGEGAADGAATAADDLEALREQVDAEYDFEDFGPADMARMSAEEWEAAFDPETWITGPELVDRVEADLKARIASRDIFGVIERESTEGGNRLLVYSDEGYATVSPDGTVEGEGGIRRDVEPVVAMCSMEEYEVGEPPAGYELPAPESVPEQTGELGNLMIQLIAGMQLLGGVGLLVAWLVTDIGLVAPVIGGLFLIVGVLLFSLVANARLSDRFRAEQYRNRLRAVETEGFDRPEVPGRTDAPAVDTDDERDSRDRETEGA
ncbi:DUF7319 domain-containing protein [Halohasta salina]|uniref:DUF7319 domain-containing protein n=1 Tax=Halohasta salina TaxID=2961621 RepID=UPI0020A3F68A|nr:hypothetical protein [Halohasta salina]